jgi:hypothetical protein
MTLSRDADRNSIVTGLKARLLFDDSRSVTMISRAGIVLLVPRTGHDPVQVPDRAGRQRLH